MDPREAAWDAVHEALPAGWRVGLPSYSPERRAWEVSAVNERTTGRGKRAQTVTGFGEDEAAALCALAWRALRSSYPLRHYG
jgi:hypothetical protein